MARAQKVGAGLASGRAPIKCLHAVHHPRFDRARLVRPGMDRLCGACGISAENEEEPERAMNDYRLVWMRRMLDRDARMVDMQVMATLVNGTAFFATTALFAIGGSLTV